MITSVTDYRDETLALLERERSDVRIEGNYMTINLGAVNPYEIHLSQIDSYKRICEWVVHLSNKIGVDALTLKHFVEKATSHLDEIRGTGRKAGQ